MFSLPSSRFCCCPVFRFIPSNVLAFAFYLFVSTKSSAPFSSHQNISRSTPPSSLPYSQSCVASKNWGTRMYFNVWQFPKFPKWMVNSKVFYSTQNSDISNWWIQYILQNCQAANCKEFYSTQNCEILNSYILWNCQTANFEDFYSIQNCEISNSYILWNCQPKNLIQPKTVKS